MQIKALEANFNLSHHSVFPSIGNEENTGARNQGEKGGTFSPAVNSPGPFQERRDFSKNTTPIKHGRETITNVVAATPIQERQPSEPVEEYGPCPILEETPEDHAKDAPPYMPCHHLWFTL